MSARTRGAIGFGIGLFAGIGLKTLWEAFRLPGYGSIIYPQSVGTTPRGSQVYLGADDAVAAGAGGVIALYGARKKNATLTGLGTGATVGVLVNKVLETMGTVVVPVACATAIPQIPDFTKC